MYLKRPVAAGWAEGKAKIHAHGSDRSLVAETEARGKFEIAHRHMKTSGGDLPEIQKHRAAELLP